MLKFLENIYESEGKRGGKKVEELPVEKHEPLTLRVVEVRSAALDSLHHHLAPKNQR